MKRSTLIIGAAAVAAVGAGAGGLYTLRGARAERQWAMLKTYCVDCHNAAEAAGGVVFEGLTPESVPQHAEVFEAAVRKLRGRLMPPPGNPQPDQHDVDGLVSFLETSIDDGAPTHAGHVPIQRLNRTEYAATVKDLLGVEIDAAEYLPTDIEVDGFDNIAAALSVSPAFLEQYISVARTVAKLAVGDAEPKVVSAYFAPPPDSSTAPAVSRARASAQDGYIDGMPLGTRGGMRFEHTFPADGEYRLTISDLEVGLYSRAIETEHTLVVLVDRNEVFREKIGGPADLALADRNGAAGRAEIMQRFANIPLQVTAGVHEVVITFIERSQASTDEPVGGFIPFGGFSFQGVVRAPRVIGGVKVEGPYNSTGVSRTASRKKLFVCTPETPAEERACAERITANLARRAFRRPVGSDDVERLLAFYDRGRAHGTFDDGIAQMVTAVLASPDFLYRAIAPPADGAATHALSSLELASRLSFFLWSQAPDDELLDLATQGKLADPDVMEAQVRRMLADERAGALVTGFALRWLNVDDLDAVDPDDRLFPAFTEDLRDDFSTEIELFLRSVLLEDRDIRELLTADYTFLNERVAKHYGIDHVRGPQFRRVTLADPARHGLLGKAAVLMRTSYGDRTSPVLRGAWVLDKLMGTPPAPPPPNVVTDLSTPEGEKPKTLRARLERHRVDPSCNGCHGVIDPYGLALENFTVLGEWRDYDAAAEEPIDASTVLPGGIEVDGPVALREALLRRPDQFVQAFTEKLMMYALGRELEHVDMPQVRAVVRQAERRNYRLSAIVAGIVNSDAFRMQGPPHGVQSTGLQAAAQTPAERN